MSNETPEGGNPNGEKVVEEKTFTNSDAKGGKTEVPIAPAVKNKRDGSAWTIAAFVAVVMLFAGALYFQEMNSREKIDEAVKKQSLAEKEVAETKRLFKIDSAKNSQNETKIAVLEGYKKNLEEELEKLRKNPPPCQSKKAKVKIYDQPVVSMKRIHQPPVGRFSQKRPQVREPAEPVQKVTISKLCALQSDGTARMKSNPSKTLEWGVFIAKEEDFPRLNNESCKQWNSRILEKYVLGY